MNEELKQRLVGAGVLLILAGVLWPLLFDFDERLYLDAPPTELESLPQTARAETKREGSAAESLANSRRVLSASGPSSAAAAPKAEVAAVVAADSAPTLDERGVPVAYVVQVGAFSNWANADRLRKALIDAGHKVAVKPHSSAEPGPYAVQVGPVMTRTEAREISAEVKRSHQLGDAMVMRFSAGR